MLVSSGTPEQPRRRTRLPHMVQHRKPLFPWRPATQDALEDALKTYVADPAFPCVGAKSALAKGTLEVIGCRDFTSAWDDVRIHDELLRFAQGYRDDPGLFRSLAMVFE